MSKNGCSSKSHCKTIRCYCKKQGKFCEENCSRCKCNAKTCSNKALSSSDDSDYDNQPLNENTEYLGHYSKSSDTIEMASDITKRIRIEVSRKKYKVFKYRNGIDIYTKTNSNDVISPEVDHIVEDQIVGHAAVVALYNQSPTPYIGILQEALNLETNDNYNVTFKSINASKGSIIKNYLRDNRNRGYPLRSLVKPESNFGKHMELIFQAMNETYPIVADYIDESRRKDGHVTVSTCHKISEELRKSFDEMDLDIYSERKLRNKRTNK